MGGAADVTSRRIHGRDRDDPGAGQRRAGQRDRMRAFAQHDPGVDHGQRRRQAGQRRHHRQRRARAGERDADEAGRLQQARHRHRRQRGARRRAQVDPEQGRERQGQQDVGAEHRRHRSQAAGGGRDANDGRNQHAEAERGAQRCPDPARNPTAFDIAGAASVGVGVATGGTRVPRHQRDPGDHQHRSTQLRRVHRLSENQPPTTASRSPPSPT